MENDNVAIIKHLYPRESCETEERKLDYQNLLAFYNGNQKSIFYEVEEDRETLESITNKYDKAKWEIEIANIEENLDYKNLKKGTIVKITEKEQDLLHCDASKKAQILPINPLQEDCEIHFKYKTNGEIKITEQNKETIKVLNLNNKLLVDNRKAILDGILSSVQALQSLRLSKEGLTQHIILLKEQFSKKDENGKYHSYSFVITSYLEQNFLNQE